MFNRNFKLGDKVYSLKFIREEYNHMRIEFEKMELTENDFVAEENDTVSFSEMTRKQNIAMR